MNKLKKRKLQLLALCTGFTGLTLGVLFFSGKGLGAYTNGLATKNTSSYSLTLNAGNKVTAAGDIVQKTALGNDVTFTYSGVASSTTGHVTLNAGGSIVNKDHIRSITSFSAVFDAAESLTKAGVNNKQEPA